MPATAVSPRGPVSFFAKMAGVTFTNAAFM
jgi:hypothetical protein